MFKRRNVPQRTCVFCRVKTNKRDLLRIVSTPSKDVVIDTAGKKNGRGAYVCLSCRNSTDRLRQETMERSLRAKIQESDWKELVRAMTTRPSSD